MQHEYDISKAFAAIENQLIASMIRNLDHHRAEETKEGIQWTQWQVEQLKYLEKYKRDNQKRFSERFQSINRSIEEMIREAKNRGGMSQEIRILEAIRKGFIASPASETMSGKFFMLNQRKLEALIKSVTQDMERAEIAILRKADDDYRKAIYNAQVYANSGAGTYEQAVDMATKDMLSRGLNCIEYANGARHTLSDYADMAIRTASKRAYLQGEGEVRRKWGIHTVIVNKRSNPCPHCLPFVGKVFIDDVWSGGKASDGNYPLLSTAIAAGLYHPRCKDSHTTYFPGISTPPDAKYTRSEIQEIEDNERRETKEQYAQRQMEKFARLSEYSLDPENKRVYGKRAEQWKHVRFKTGEKSAEEYVELQRFREGFNAVKTSQVVEILRKDSEGWISALTDFEKIAIQKYTFNPGDKKHDRFFERINSMLFKRDTDERLQRYADAISSSINKNRLRRNIVVFRGSDYDLSVGKERGEIFKVDPFTSTSAIETRALKGNYHFTIYVRGESRAAYVESLSLFPNQREVLIDKGTIFRVLSRQGNNVILEVIK
ncbi:phage minor capsid protein [Oribacterium sp. HCP28S3_H8]|uniref:phage minor capsid protein n=1 Tax=Oribacterium sp. HCP28S3_H8 TaxID=3438945 RepID=UPI003F899D93